MDTGIAEFPKRAWLTIWARPRETMRAILNSDPKRDVYLLAALGGAAAGITQMVSQLDKIMAFRGVAIWSFILFGVVVVAPLVGVFMLWVSSVLLHWTGKWIDGKGSREQIMAALAWSQIPSIALAVGIVVFLVAYGVVFLLATQEIAHVVGVTFAALFVLPMIGAMVWKMIIYFNCLAEAQEFQSAWKAVANSAIASAIVFAVLAVPFGIMMAILIPALMRH